MKRLTLLLEGLVTDALLPGLTASLVSAVDLTGTWEGTVTCTAVERTRVQATQTQVQMLITQTGTGLTLYLPNFTGGPVFRGTVRAHATTPDTGEAGVMLCGTDPTTPFGVMGHATVATPANAKGTLVATTIGFDRELVGTCTATFERVSTTPPTPVVPGCAG